MLFMLPLPPFFSFSPSRHHPSLQRLPAAKVHSGPVLLYVLWNQLIIPLRVLRYSTYMYNTCTVHVSVILLMTIAWPPSVLYVLYTADCIASGSSRRNNPPPANCRPLLSLQLQLLSSSEKVERAAVSGLQSRIGFPRPGKVRDQTDNRIGVM